MALGMQKFSLAFKQLTLVLWINVTVCCFAELERFHHPPKSPGSIRFLVIGDWGREGTHNQSEVASQMGRIGEELDIDFVVSTGDNFYDNGIKGITDPLFKNSFTDVYTHKSLQKPWYTVLGNHDYRGNVKAQLNPMLRNIDSRWLCLRSFMLDTDIAEIFFVDTTPFVDKYFDDPEEHVYDWRSIHPRRRYTDILLKDLDMELKKSTAKWKIVVGHHTIRSMAHHGDTLELIEKLTPILEANHVNFYINGHDHCLQRIICSPSKLEYITSGAGSKAWRGEHQEHEKCAVQFIHDGQGFLSVQITENDAFFVFYDVFGIPMHKWSASKQLHSDL